MLFWVHNMGGFVCMSIWLHGFMTFIDCTACWNQNGWTSASSLVFMSFTQSGDQVDTEVAVSQSMTGD